MKKRLFFTIIAVFNMAAIHAYGLRVDTIYFDSNGYITNQLIITIDNTDDEPLWIWLEDEEDKKKDGDERKKSAGIS